MDDVVAGGKETTNRRKLGIAILNSEVNFSEMQSAVEALLRGVGTGYKLKEGTNPSLLKGRCGEIVVAGKIAGIFGEVHPEVVTNFGLDYPVAIAEIDVESIF